MPTTTLRDYPIKAWTRSLRWQRFNCDLPRWSIFAWLAGSSAVQRTPRSHNGGSRPIGNLHASTGRGVQMDQTYTNLPARNVFNTNLGYQLYQSGKVGP
jgi:hypothetical protein